MSERSIWAQRFASVLRIVAAFLFMAHGTQKLFGFPGPGGSPVDLASLRGVAGVLECFGGLLILIGLFTRPVAFVLAGQMAYAYFSAHAKQGFWPILNRGELAALYSFLWLFFSAAGAGPWSLDAVLRHRKRQAGFSNVEKMPGRSATGGG